MKLHLILGTLAAAVVLGGGAVISAQSAEQTVCVARAPDTLGQRVGYELIDLARREAWVTTDWSLTAYRAFSTGLTSLHWIKNDPRAGFADRAQVLRSPGCAQEGEFTYQTMFGREFFHIADVDDVQPRVLTRGALPQAMVTKYHRLSFAAGQRVSYLVAPDGMAFVGVNRPVEAPGIGGGLPDGWALQDSTLAQAWDADLAGPVRVLWLADGTSYQGPVDPGPAVSQ